MIWVPAAFTVIAEVTATPPKETALAPMKPRLSP